MEDKPGDSAQQKADDKMLRDAVKTDEQKYGSNASGQPTSPP